MSTQQTSPNMSADAASTSKCDLCLQVHCNFCSNAHSTEEQWPSAWISTWHEASLQCAFCALVVDAVGEINAFTDFEGYGTALFYFRMSVLLPGSCNLIIDYRDRITAHAYTGRGVSRGVPIDPPILNVDVCSDKILHWLDICSSDHLECKRESIPAIPTRVLKILGEKTVKLHCPLESERQDYACLSYCWGDPKFMIKTLKDTYQSHLAEIPWEELPELFRDAIALCRSIGIEYLWIDSLCIIQDDLDDWRREGSKMASIYANSCITFAASASRSAREGLFRPEAGHLLELRSRIANHPLRAYILPYLAHRNFDHDAFPLQYRAWAFQESVLAPLIVHFTDVEVIWECSRGRKSEYDNQMITYSVPWGLKSTLLKLQIPSEESKNTALGKWLEAVSHYSELRLSYQSDTLPALQGVAKKLQGHLGQYYAGIWRHLLCVGLAWFTYSPTVRKVPWCAPTWSWASLSGGVSHRFHPFGELARIREVASILAITTTPAGQDDTGDVTAGSMTIQGRCVRADMAAATKSVEMSRSHRAARFDGVFKFLDGSRSILIDMVLPDDNGGIYWLPDLLHESGVYDDVLLMKTLESESDSRMAYFLAFAKVNDRDIYERVGSAQFENAKVLGEFDALAEEKIVTVV